MRFIIENFVNKNDAKKLINFFEKNDHLCSDDREFHKNRNIHYSSIKDQFIRNLLDYYASKTIFFVDHYFDTRTRLWQPMRLCRWKKGEEMYFHTDRVSTDKMDFSSLIYLNDNYSGGELYFEKEIFKMKTLSSIIFESGAHNKHGVKPVLKGKRYTIPSWYQKWL